MKTLAIYLDHRSKTKVQENEISNNRSRKNKTNQKNEYQYKTFYQ